VDESHILGRYRPIAELGVGGHGSVVLAFDTKMARRVAIKQLPLPTDRSGSPVSRAGLAEARTAALLNHPCIVTVHEWDTDSSFAYIVMEDVDGLSLADILDETRSPLDADETAAVLEAVAAAVGYAHENGVLHLDLKPGNVLVTRSGRVKVADFGVSALTDAGGFAHGTAGTIGYMPPEQIRDQDLDERTDVWALAALTYELLTDANPFDSDTAEGSLFKIEIADVPAPSEFEPGLAKGLDDALLDALEPDPRNRPRSVARFADSITPYLGGPAAGRESLAALVTSLLGDEGDDEESGRAEGLWDRLAPRAGIYRRTGAAAVCAWLGWAGLGAFGLGTVPTIGASGMLALAGALAPGLGLVLGLAAFTAGVARTGGWVTGVAFGAAALAFWLAQGRAGHGDSLAPFAAPVLGMARTAPGLPLLVGLAFSPVSAAISAGAAGALLAAASGASGGIGPHLTTSWQLLVRPWAADGLAGLASGSEFDPMLLAVPLLWAAAAAICSAGAGRGTRAGATIGVLLGAGVLAGGYALWALVADPPFGPLAWAPDVAIGLGIALVAVALGPPVRDAEE
jgi:serine/threonine-protein kinase